MTELNVYLGPVWVVPFCAGRQPALILSIGALLASFGDHATILSSPSLTSAGFALGFLPAGVNLVLAEEDAAVAVAQRTGRRVKSVPRLLRGDPPLAGYNFAWQVDIEAPVEVRSLDTGRLRRTATFFFGNLAHRDWAKEVVVSSPTIGDSSMTVDVRSQRQGVVRQSIIRTLQPHYATLEVVELSQGRAP